MILVQYLLPRLTFALLGLCRCTVLGNVEAVSVATILVTSTDDEADLPDFENGQCSLREALLSAETDDEKGGCIGAFYSSDACVFPVLNLENVRLTECEADRGGTVYINGQLIANNIEVIDNESDDTEFC